MYKEIDGKLLKLFKNKIVTDNCVLVNSTKINGLLGTLLIIYFVV